MNQTQGYVFQILEIISDNPYLIVAGLAFDTIVKNDVLFLSKSEEDRINLKVIGISLYGNQVDEITRGLTAQLVIEYDTHITMTEDSYLYKCD